jgi:hypothetical protein
MIYGNMIEKPFAMSSDDPCSTFGGRVVRGDQVWSSPYFDAGLENK